MSVSIGEIIVTGVVNGSGSWSVKFVGLSDGIKTANATFVDGE